MHGSLALGRDAVAVEEAGGAGQVATAPAALCRDAEVGDGPRRGRDAAPVAHAISTVLVGSSWGTAAQIFARSAPKARSQAAKNSGREEGATNQ